MLSCYAGSNAKSSSGPPRSASWVTWTTEGEQASTGAITSDHWRSSPQWQCSSITMAGGGSMPASERNTVPWSQRDDLTQGMSSCKHKRKHSEGGGQETHTAPAMSSVHVSVLLCLYTSGTAGREWAWGSHPTTTTRIVKVAMVKWYYEAIAEIRHVDDSFHQVCVCGCVCMRMHACICVISKIWASSSSPSISE